MVCLNVLFIILGVCVFPMATIMREFQIAQRDCYTGMGDLLPWIHPGNIGCHAYVSVLLSVEVFLHIYNVQ